MTQYLVSLPPVLFDTIGVAGFCLYVMNYSLLTFQRLGSDSVTYFVINFSAATMVLIGLLSSFNLAAAMIQIFWIGISSVAIIIRLRNRGKPRSRFSHSN